jgi:hypothetical protein
MAMTTMVGMSTVPPQLRRQLASTRAGRRYQRLLHAHAPAVEFLVTVYPDVREHVETALERLLAAAGAGPIDRETLVATSRVLDDLDRFGTDHFAHGRRLHCVFRHPRRRSLEK